MSDILATNREFLRTLLQGTPSFAHATLARLLCALASTEVQSEGDRLRLSTSHAAAAGAEVTMAPTARTSSSLLEQLLLFELDRCTTSSPRTELLSFRSRNHHSFLRGDAVVPQVWDDFGKRHIVPHWTAAVHRLLDIHHDQEETTTTTTTTRFAVKPNAADRFFRCSKTTTVFDDSDEDITELFSPPASSGGVTEEEQLAQDVQQLQGDIQMFCDTIAQSLRVLPPSWCRCFRLVADGLESTTMEGTHPNTEKATDGAEDGTSPNSSHSKAMEFAGAMIVLRLVAPMVLDRSHSHPPPVFPTATGGAAAQDSTTTTATESSSRALLRSRSVFWSKLWMKAVSQQPFVLLIPGQEPLTERQAALNELVRFAAESLQSAVLRPLLTFDTPSAAAAAAVPVSTRSADETSDHNNNSNNNKTTSSASSSTGALVSLLHPLSSDATPSVELLALYRFVDRHAPDLVQWMNQQRPLGVTLHWELLMHWSQYYQRCLATSLPPPPQHPPTPSKLRRLSMPPPASAGSSTLNTPRDTDQGSEVTNRSMAAESACSGVSPSPPPPTAIVNTASPRQQNKNSSGGPNPFAFAKSLFAKLTAKNSNDNPTACTPPPTPLTSRSAFSDGGGEMPPSSNHLFLDDPASHRSDDPPVVSSSSGLNAKHADKAKEDTMDREEAFWEMVQHAARCRLHAEETMNYPAHTFCTVAGTMPSSLESSQSAMAADCSSEGGGLLPSPEGGNNTSTTLILLYGDLAYQCAVGFFAKQRERNTAVLEKCLPRMRALLRKGTSTGGEAAGGTDDAAAYLALTLHQIMGDAPTTTEDPTTTTIMQNNINSNKKNGYSILFFPTAEPLKSGCGTRWLRDLMVHVFPPHIVKGCQSIVLVQPGKSQLTKRLFSSKVGPMSMIPCSSIVDGLTSMGLWSSSTRGGGGKQLCGGGLLHLPLPLREALILQSELATASPSSSSVSKQPSGFYLNNNNSNSNGGPSSLNAVSASSFAFDATFRELSFSPQMTSTQFHADPTTLLLSSVSRENSEAAYLPPSSGAAAVGNNSFAISEAMGSPPSYIGRSTTEFPATLEGDSHSPFLHLLDEDDAADVLRRTRGPLWAPDTLLDVLRLLRFVVVDGTAAFGIPAPHLVPFRQRAMEWFAQFTPSLVDHLQHPPRRRASTAASGSATTAPSSQPTAHTPARDGSHSPHQQAAPMMLSPLLPSAQPAVQRQWISTWFGFLTANVEPNVMAEFEWYMQRYLSQCDATGFFAAPRFQTALPYDCVVPSLKHISLRSMWRMSLFNIAKSFEIIANSNNSTKGRTTSLRPDDTDEMTAAALPLPLPQRIMQWMKVELGSSERRAEVLQRRDVIHQLCTPASRLRRALDLSATEKKLLEAVAECVQVLRHGQPSPKSGSEHPSSASPCQGIDVYSMIDYRIASGICRIVLGVPSATPAHYHQHVPHHHQQQQQQEGESEANISNTSASSSSAPSPPGTFDVTVGAVSLLLACYSTLLTAS